MLIGRERRSGHRLPRYYPNTLTPPRAGKLSQRTQVEMHLRHLVKARLGSLPIISVLYTSGLHSRATRQLGMLVLWTDKGVFDGQGEICPRAPVDPSPHGINGPGKSLVLKLQLAGSSGGYRSNAWSSAELEFLPDRFPSQERASKECGHYTSARTNTRAKSRYFRECECMGVRALILQSEVVVTMDCFLTSNRESE